MIDTARRQRIQSRVVAGKDALVRLESQVPDVGFKEYFLTPPMNGFGDVERMWLSSVDDSRTRAAEAFWLSNAELVLDIAESQLRAAQAAFNKYGPGVHLVG